MDHPDGAEDLLESLSAREIKSKRDGDSSIQKCFCHATKSIGNLVHNISQHLTMLQIIFEAYILRFNIANQVVNVEETIEIQTKKNRQVQTICDDSPIKGASVPPFRLFVNIKS